MVTITLKINERTKKGKAFLEMARPFFEDSKEIEIIKVPNAISSPKTPSKRKATSEKVLQDLDLAFKQLTTAKKRSLNRKTLDELLNEK
jgi:hypothetical protein